MNTPAAETGRRPSLLEIEGTQILSTSPGFAEAIAGAYVRRHRPHCLCRPEGVEMYIARLADGYIVKRMPETGEQHAPACPSYEPPVEQSGIHPLLGTAIKEDPATGMTLLKLGFSLSKRPGRACPSRTPSVNSTVSGTNTRLSLRALLHYLWDQAELTRWHPGFEGRRTWGVVRRQLLLAATSLVACGEPLAARLDIPEPFSVENREAIEARRIRRWNETKGSGVQGQRLLLLIAELKEIAPSRQGYMAVIKHVPDHGFALDGTLYRRIENRFERELELWSAAIDARMILIATMSIRGSGLPRIAALSLMTVTEHWLPVEGWAEMQLVKSLVRDRRSFSKMPRYDLHPEARHPSLALTDEGDPARLVFTDNCPSLLG